MKRRIEIELDLEDTETFTIRRNVVGQLVRGIVNIVDKLSGDLADNEHETVNINEIGAAFSNALQNISEYMILDELNNIVMHEDEDDIEGDAEIAGHFVEALGGKEIIENRKASVGI